MFRSPKVHPKMIVSYEWILENVGQEPMMIASKMISFRGQKVFRVGLKNYDKYCVLFFVAIDLNKIGMEVEDVTYRIQGSGSAGPVIMKKITKENIGGCENLHLFKTLIDEKIVGNRTFSFRIVIAGTSDYYCYRLSDRLAKDQIWAFLKNQQNLADAELIVKDRVFPVHKFILIARGYTLSADSKKLFILPVKDGPHQIRIDDGVEPSTVENFLHFVYTGETMATLADEKLVHLALRFGLTTLNTIGETAMMEIEATAMTKLMESLNNEIDAVYSSKIMPEKETEISFDRTPTLRCTLSLNGFGKSVIGLTKCIMEYQEEELFFAYITGDYVESYIMEPVIHVTCAKHRKFGLKVEDIYCSTKEQNQWFKMEPKKSKNSTELLHHFTVNWDLDLQCSPIEFNFDIKVVTTIGNYYYEMMDKHWLKGLWAAATKEKLTDVEIFVGTVKMMEAHRVILCARSPVLNESLNKISNTEKSIVTFGAEFDKDVVDCFLNFLYTGRLDWSRDWSRDWSAKVMLMQLSKLAEVYEVETLKNICQLLNANPPDAEDVTDYLLEL